ncbi:MAG: DUF4402 domain-containing protein [Acidobacteriota bacterium]
MKISVAVTAVAVAAVVLFSAATLDAATGTASVQIVNAISISNTVGLSFGQVIGGSGASVVTVTPQGVRTLTSGTAVLAGGVVTGASFPVTGGVGSTYTITLPTGSVALTGPSLMGLSNITSFPTVANGGLLNGSGQQTLLVGGQLDIIASPNSGLYSGAFDVTVAYN